MHLDILWAPWRSSYITSIVKGDDYKSKCIFCELPKKDDEDALILLRGKSCYAVMNAFPYNTGHLMVAPYRHVASLEDLDDNELLELMKIVNTAIRCLRLALRPDGFNIGVNIGRAAGAGFEHHVHVHIVPRWVGDANFMPVTAGVKVLPEALSDTYAKLRKALKELVESK